MASMFSTSETIDIAFRFLSTSASLAGILMLIQSVASKFMSEFILDKLKSYFFSFFEYLLSFFRYLLSFFHYLFTRPSTNRTLVINECSGKSRNKVYDAAELYLPTKIGPETKRLGLSKIEKQKDFAFSMEKGEEIVDIVQGIQWKWRYIKKRGEESRKEEKFFELSFGYKFQDEEVKVYLRHVLAKAKEIKEETKLVEIYSWDSQPSWSWSSTILEHPATFETVAMDPELKEKIIDDLKRFLGRREFYKKVGKAWKRGYLLYGPPGTGKSSLIAAMANYLNFDIYNLELASIYSNSDLQKALLLTTKRSILVIEDIDCSIQAQDRENPLESDNSNRRESDNSNGRLTLSGILNFTDGLWSSCGDERIIVLTTNHKDRLDPALLRPGRMDVHINLSYCTVDAFRILASNYLDISNREDPQFGEMESLIRSTEVTPAEVAGELMCSEDPELALQGLVDFIKHKRSRCDKIEKEVAEIEKAHSLKSDNEEKEIIVRRKRRRGIRIATGRRPGKGGTKD